MSESLIYIVCYLSSKCIFILFLDHTKIIEGQPDLPKLGPQERGRVVDVSHRLGTPNLPPPEWLLPTPVDKIPKPEREAFPPPPRNEGFFFSFFYYMNKSLL